MGLIAPTNSYYQEMVPVLLGNACQVVTEFITAYHTKTLVGVSKRVL